MNEPSYLCPVGPRTTDVPHPGASTLISAPRSNQLSYQVRNQSDDRGVSRIFERGGSNILRFPKKRSSDFKRGGPMV